LFFEETNPDKYEWNKVTTNCFGYYTRLKKLNKTLDELYEEIAKYSEPIMQA
jgi:hypothetical protein